MLVYGYDANGFYNKDIYEADDPNKKSGNYTDVKMTQSYYLPKFDGVAWSEGATSEQLEEFKIAADELNKKSQEENIYNKIARLEKRMEEIEEKINLNI